MNKLIDVDEMVTQWIPVQNIVYPLCNHQSISSSLHRYRGTQWLTLNHTISYRSVWSSCDIVTWYHMHQWYIIWWHHAFNILDIIWSYDVSCDTPYDFPNVISNIACFPRGGERFGSNAVHPIKIEVKCLDARPFLDRSTFLAFMTQTTEFLKPGRTIEVWHGFVVPHTKTCGVCDISISRFRLAIGRVVAARGFRCVW